jgi:hypothetical protein
MTFDEFEARARQEWARIPAEYKAGVDGVVIERAARPHASHDGVYTLGECLTESYPSDFGGPDTTRSVVVLYYGSFFRLSREDDAFDWEGELWETLTHELQHHLESLAADDALVDMDYAADENFKRYQGEPFDPFFFRQGLREQGWYRIEDEYFLEVPEPVPGAPVHFEWDEVAYEIDVPTEPSDVMFLTIVDGVANAPDALHVVVVARRGLLATLRELVLRSPAVLAELDVKARPA